MSAPVSRLRGMDLAGLAFHGIRSHPLRAILSGLGIAVGIAAMIAVLGISTSSQALVQKRLAEIGTNLLTVTAGTDLLGEETELSAEAISRVHRIDGVESASWTANLDGVKVYRSSWVDPGVTGGLTVRTAEQEMAETVGASFSAGGWFSDVTNDINTVVLGSRTAAQLGITRVGSRVFLGDRSFTVIGILRPVLLAPELDSTALVSPSRAIEVFGASGVPTTLYERSTEESVLTVRALLPQTVKPLAPQDIKVSRPSDALAAKSAVNEVFTGLLLGVGSIALLVGGIGVANTMVITVLERRREIGLRRSLGATRAHIRRQFLAEAILLASLGGVAGAILGYGVTAVVAAINGWLVSIPMEVLIGGVVATVMVGALAGALPAARAARTPPTAAMSG